MIKSFKYRLYPTKKQISILNQTLGECRWLYNHLLEQRKNAWENDKKSVSRFDQCNTFKQLKTDKPTLKIVHSQVLQNVATRIDLAFKAFFRRVKSSKKPGYPRFRSKSRYDSFTYPQSGFKIIKDRAVIQLSKIGRIKTKLHRSVNGNIKTCTISKTNTNKWYITFDCKIKQNPLPQNIEKIGIDVGLEAFATLSNGEIIENPRFFKTKEKILSKAQSKFSKQKKGSFRKKKASKVVAHIHEKIKNKRLDFTHKLARNLVNRFGIIVVEDLFINNMKKSNFRCINKSISDTAWYMFITLLSKKAEDAARKVVKINPAYTSQTCSKCGKRHKLKLSERIFNCPYCHLSLNRDFNASLNILALGMKSLALA